MAQSRGAVGTSDGSLEDVLRAMNVIRRVPFELAHRYRRLAIEDLH